MTSKPKLLPPVRPSLGDEVALRRKLTALLDEMHCSILYWLRAAYRSNTPELATDELPATTLKRAVRGLARRWQGQFNAAAPALGRYFALKADRRSAGRLRKILKDGGFTVQMRDTRAVQDVLHASINESVALIKSIPQKYLTDVEGAVMRSVQTGRDLGTLTRELEASYNVTRKRAAFISRDQNNKATATLTRVRQQSLGIKEAIWVHSGGGKVPRPTHVKASKDRVRYNVDEGWYDPHEERHIFPGELINCRCVSRAVVPGFV